MQTHGLATGSNGAHAPVIRQEEGRLTPRFHVCIDTVDGSSKAIIPAKVLAHAFGAQLSFVHVIEVPGAAGQPPQDPVEWDIRRREAEARITGLARGAADDQTDISVQILEGRCAEQICKMLSERPGDIAVLCRSHGADGARMGETARCLIETGTSSLLIIPETEIETKTQGFSRIALLLDGSGQSENAIPFALQIAQSENAEIILVHAVPEPTLTQAGPPDPRDDELMGEIRRRNTRVAKKYLNRQAARLREGGISTRTVILSGGDVRRQLVTAFSEQMPDLVVLASHGQSGFADTALGSVAAYVITKSAIPVLMIRRGTEAVTDHVFSAASSKGVRGPGAPAR